MCVQFRGTLRLFLRDVTKIDTFIFYGSCTVHKKVCCIFLLQSLRDFSKKYIHYFFVYGPFTEKNTGNYLQYHDSTHFHLLYLCCHGNTHWLQHDSFWHLISHFQTNHKDILVFTHINIFSLSLTHSISNYFLASIFFPLIFCPLSILSHIFSPLTKHGFIIPNFIFYDPW